MKYRVDGVKLFDDLIPMARRAAMYQFVRGSLYRIGWHDTEAIENKAHQYLHSDYNDQDLLKLGLLVDLKDTPVAALLPQGRTPVRCVVNLSVPNEANWVHTHPDQTVLLYYANLQWQPEWAGETLFFDERGREVVYASAYRPGRVIVFDGHVPHAIRTQSAVAPHYRFSVSVFFQGRMPGVR
jgi:SM-20-related protein